MDLVFPNGQVNVFREEDTLSFYTLKTKKWVTTWERVPPTKILQTELDLTEGNPETQPFWNLSEVQQQPETTFYQTPIWNFKKIGKKQWAELISLYEHYAFSLTPSNLEVGTFILFDENTQELKLVIPEQRVSTTAVQFDKILDKPVSTLDGSEKKLFKEWLQDHSFLGYCHSHNTMEVNAPSSIDDNTELEFNGIHILLSAFKPSNANSLIPQFKLYCSYSLHGSRFQIQPTEFIEESALAISEEEYVDNLFDYQVTSLVTRIPTRVFKGKGTFVKGNNKALKPSNSGVQYTESSFDWEQYWGFTEGDGYDIYEDPFGYWDGDDSLPATSPSTDGTLWKVGAGRLPSEMESSLDVLTRSAILSKKFKDSDSLIKAIVKNLYRINWYDAVKESYRINSQIIKGGFDFQVEDDNSAVTYEVIEADAEEV